MDTCFGRRICDSGSGGGGDMLYGMIAVFLFGKGARDVEKVVGSL